MNRIEQIVRKAERIVVFSGAGFSTESNIPDFRSEHGVYQKQTYPYAAEVMLSHDFFVHHTEQFYTFYRNEMVHLQALPNKGHAAVAKLEKLNKLEAVITQNIDGLHQKAGNTKVLELHGSIHRNYCMHCHSDYDVSTIMEKQPIPHCVQCGGIIKPDVVLYQEGLDANVMEQAIVSLQKADVLIVAGTSLVVYPAAGLLRHFNGSHIILINHDATDMDTIADVVSRRNIGDALNFINEDM